MCELQKKDLNAFFVHIFNLILSWEESSLKSICRKTGLTVREIHIIEAVCTLEGKGNNTMANAAKLLAVSPGSLTTSVNSIVNKGYICRSYTPSDRRVVYISATQSGREVNDEHKKIHDELIEQVRRQIPAEDFERIVSALKTLNDFLLDKDFSRE